MKAKVSKMFQYQIHDNCSKLNFLTHTARSHTKIPLTEFTTYKDTFDSRNNKGRYNNTEGGLFSPKDNVSEGIHLKSKTIQENHKLKLRESYSGSVTNFNSTDKRVFRTIQKHTSNKKQEPLKVLSINPLSEMNKENPQLKCLTARGGETVGYDYALKPGAEISIPDYKPAKYSLKGNGLIKAYAVNTNKGLVRQFFF